MTTPYPSGPQGDPLLGCLRPIARDTLGFLTQTARAYGDLVHFKALHKHIYLLNCPDAIQQVLVEQSDKIRKGPALRRNTYVAFGDGLLTSEGALHARQRRLIQPAFHPRRVDGYFDTMLESTDALLATWEHDTTRDLHADMTALTITITARALFGADVSALAGELGAAVGQGMEILGRRIAKPPALRMPDAIPTAENQLRQRILALLNGTIYDIIAARRGIPADDRGDLLSMLLLAQDADGSGMSDQQIRDEVMTIFLAGHETTANALAWALYLLALHPDVEQQMRAEIATLGGRAPTLADLARLTYTECVFKEALRMYPPAWATSRQALAPLTVCGWTIPAGSTLVISPYAMHHNPRYFAAPEQFDPERFSPQRRAQIPRYAYFPFGAGARGCIGAQFATSEALLILTRIYQRFRLVRAAQTPIALDPLITLRPKGGVPLRIIENSQSS